MTLEALKNSILNKNLHDSFFIFEISDNDFIANQYSRAIASIKNREIVYIEDLDFLIEDFSSLFRIDDYDYLYIYKCDSLDVVNPKLKDVENLIIITSSISKDIKKEYSYNVVEIPVLEDWQVKDYAYTIGEGIDKEDLDYLLEVSGYNIFRVESELTKLKNFSNTQRKYLFKQIIQEGGLGDLAQYNIFNLTNAIQARDIDKVKELAKTNFLSNIEPMDLISTLYQNFRKMILVWLDKNPTQESTGLKGNQIWAIKNIPHNYSKDQLIKIFKFLTSLDLELKSGNLPNNDLTDYIITRILTF